MDKQKIDEKYLEDVAGGVVAEGPYSLSFSGGQIVMSYAHQSTSRTYTEAQFVSSLSSQGIPAEKVHELIDLIKSDRSFDSKEVKDLTGIDLGFSRS